MSSLPVSPVKKNRPNFRPSQQRKAPKASQPVEAETGHHSSSSETPASSARETSFQPLTAAEPPKVDTPSKRGRKRKAVAVGSSRAPFLPPSNFPTTLPSAPAPPTSASSTTQKPQIPVDTSGMPTLSTFCSKFRSKLKKTEKTETGVTAAPETANPTAPSNFTTTTTSTITTAGPVVQVVNGEIVLQENSIVVTGPSATSKPEEELPVVEEEAHLAVVGASYNSFVARRAPQHWTIEETQLFYEALRQVGTDFGTMEAYFEKRTRKQLKRKYQIEMTKNPQLIEKALDPAVKKEIDMSVFAVTAEEPSRKAAPKIKARKDALQKQPRKGKNKTHAAAEKPNQPSVAVPTLPEINEPSPLLQQEELPVVTTITLPGRVETTSTKRSRRPKFRSRKIRPKV